MADELLIRTTPIALFDANVLLRACGRVHHVRSIPGRCRARRQPSARRRHARGGGARQRGDAAEHARQHEHAVLAEALGH